MVEPAISKMTVPDFLEWEDGSDTRYELVGGAVFAMAPPAPAHGFLAARLCARIEIALRLRPPCLVQIEAGIARPDRDDTCYIADLAVTCNPPPRAAQLIRDPVLIVEVLSPGTALYDRQVKVSDYRQIESVREILLIDSERVFAEILRREGDRWLTEIVRDLAAGLTLASVGLEMPIAELYEGIDISDAIVVPYIGPRSPP